MECLPALPGDIPTIPPKGGVSDPGRAETESKHGWEVSTRFFILCDPGDIPSQVFLHVQVGVSGNHDSLGLG